jgi:hypothetical protein
MRWFFLMSFVAALIVCALLTSFIIFALATRGVGGFRVVLVFLPQIVFFGWAPERCFDLSKVSASMSDSRNSP